MAEEHQSETPKKASAFKDFLEHQSKAAQETYKALDALIPPDFRTHSKEARKEFLMSFKVLIDGVASAVDSELEKVRSNVNKQTSDTSGGPSTTGKAKVKIEVS